MNEALRLESAAGSPHLADIADPSAAAVPAATASPPTPPATPSPAPDAAAADVDELSLRLKSISISSSSYLDYTESFDEPLRLVGDASEAPSHRLLINASGRWGHDVIYFATSRAADPTTTEFHFSAGYNVTWYKEFIVSAATGGADEEIAKVRTRNEDRGPKTIVVKEEQFPSGNIKIDFCKAGFLGLYTHAYTRYLEAESLRGVAVQILWARDRFST